MKPRLCTNIGRHVIVKMQWLFLTPHLIIYIIFLTTQQAICLGLFKNDFNTPKLVCRNPKILMIGAHMIVYNYLKGFFERRGVKEIEQYLGG